jgi:sec-independent protein translocase protein TatA
MYTIVVPGCAIVDKSESYEDPSAGPRPAFCTIGQPLIRSDIPPPSLEFRRGTGYSEYRSSGGVLRAAPAGGSTTPKEVRMFGIGFQEMLIILVVVLIFFGPKRLPDLAKSLGKGIAEFKKASDEVRKGIEDAVKEESTAETPTPPEDLSAYGKAPGGASATEETARDGSGPARETASPEAGAAGPAPSAEVPAAEDGTAPDAAPAEPSPPAADAAAAETPAPPPRPG